MLKARLVSAFNRLSNERIQRVKKVIIRMHCKATLTFFGDMSVYTVHCTLYPLYISKWMVMSHDMCQVKINDLFKDILHICLRQTSLYFLCVFGFLCLVEFHFIWNGTTEQNPDPDYILTILTQQVWNNFSQKFTFISI